MNLRHAKGNLWLVVGLVSASCGAPAQQTMPASQSNPVTSLPAAPPAPTNSTPTTPAATPAAAPGPVQEPAASPPLDEKAIVAETGAEKADVADGVIKVSFPRKDVPVTVDGWKIAPFMGVTSWVAFSPGQAGKAEAMIMGDLVLFEDEVNPVMSALIDHGVEVTALHNHFMYDTPHVFFMHIGGEGQARALAKGIRGAFDKVADIRKKSQKPAASFGVGALPSKSSIDGAKIEAVLGVKGQSKDGMWKAVMGRSARASCGCPIGKAMGVNTWSAFAGTDENAVVDGDFAVSESELQPVLRSLRTGGINVVSIHHHMSGESPRLLFLHYWGRGKPADLATIIRKTLDLTEWDGKAKPSAT